SVVVPRGTVYHKLGQVRHRLRVGPTTKRAFKESHVCVRAPNNTRFRKSTGRQLGSLSFEKSRGLGSRSRELLDD
ncbi:hypothetical protein MUK42_05803, partial [Musa troglodytarum]